MPTPIPASSYPLLMDLINQTYLDRVERIDGAQVDDGDNIICAATDGRKALAVRVTDDGIDIKLRGAQARSPQFAAAKKPSKCGKGISCGDGCISAAKVCRKKTTPKQKAQKQKIVADAKGGALVPIGGKLSTTDKKSSNSAEGEKSAENAQTKTPNDLIDEKYASENPSNSDVANWTKERVNAHFEPTPENIAQRAVKEAKRTLGLEETGREDLDYGKFSGKVKDRDSYAKASVAYEEWQKKKHPEALARSADPETWIRSLKSEGKLSDAELTKIQGQVAKGSAAAAKKLAKHNAAVAAEPAQRIRAQELAARHQAAQSQSRSERLSHYKQKFDEIQASQKQKMEQAWEPIQAGKKSALKDAREEALGGVIPRRDSLKRGVYMPISDGDIKEHLQGLAKKRDTDMFSGGTKADVRKQYRDLAAKYHPDNKTTGDEKEFRRVTDAYNQKLEEFN
jgi:hypothetical protein